MLPKRTGRESPTRAAPRGRDAPFAIPPLTPPPFPAFPAFLAFLAFFSLAATGGFVPGLFAPALFAQIPDGTGAPGEAETPSATETNPADENNAGQIVIDSERIARMKVNKVEDVLNQAPGVSASSSSVSVHGSSKVRVFLDGTPLNDPTSSYGAVNLDHISLNSVDRIVIVKDAGGLHYGHDATGGVILIHTKNFAENRNTGQIRLWAGNHDSYRGDADLMFARGPWSLGVKGGYETTRGYKINNDSTRRRGGARVSRSFGENGTASLAVDLLTEETGFSGLPAFPTPHSRQWSRNLALTQGTTWGGYSNNLYFNRGNVKNKDPSRG
ncbi:MAG: TonB-dependent receptor plug domain-containing protein, partial [Deltaproteobacteria bacterium]|nr:TonB-dependent receptor plug domain-containing protein [Deltaproteobacteria bacterium]